MNRINKPPMRIKKAGSDMIFRVMVIWGMVSFSIASVLSCEEDDIVFGHAPVFVQGEVRDSLTLQPIDSVIISVLDTGSAATLSFTDSLGVFNLGVLGNGARLFFRKVGYETNMIRTNSNDTPTVLLAPE